MGRRPRNNAPGVWAHVFNRAQKNRTLFPRDIDRFTCLGLLREQVDLGRIVVHAYCLMGNHYHLLVESPVGQLDHAMRDFGRGFTKLQNRHYNTDGALFRARYNAKYVDLESDYRLTLLHYIEQNPVRAGLVARPEHYPWSSANPDASELPVSPWTPRARLQLQADRGLPVAERVALVEERMVHPGQRDALEALGAVDFAARWLAARRGAGGFAPLAQSRDWLPIVPRATVLRVVHARAPARERSALALGLLLDLAGVEQTAAAALLDIPRYDQRRELARYASDLQAVAVTLAAEVVAEVLRQVPREAHHTTAPALDGPSLAHSLPG